MKLRLPACLAAAVLVACADTSPIAPVVPTPDASLARKPDGTVYVTNAHDGGNGSLRDAIATAGADPSISTIVIKKNVKPIALRSTITFAGTQDLAIEGSDAVVDAVGARGTALAFIGGGDLRVDGLTVRNAPGEGIHVEVPSHATGTQKVTLLNVAIEDNRGHGVLVNDQVDPSATDNVEPDARGSDASLEVNVIASTFVRNGYSVSDRDGLRVNEGGLGDLTLHFALSTAADNGADGVEIDERGAGDVKVTMATSRLTRNGKFDPADLDDGFDIDEYQDGSVIATIAYTAANDNYEEGFDINENGTGDFRVDMHHVEANNNTEEGIDFEEDDDDATWGSPGGGNLITTLVAVTANGNGSLDGDAGLKIREKLLGSLNATVSGVEASQNVIGGISVREDGDGSLLSSITNATVLGNGGHGIDFDENAAGDLTASVAASTSSNNAGAGVRADQQLASGAGVGALTLTAVTLSGNGGGATAGSNVSVTFIP